MRRLFFITHADVVIDPDVPVPEWRLNAQGRARHAAFAEICPKVAAVWSSHERKALDGAEILAEKQGLSVRSLADLGENDRSATGYLPKEEFEATARQFFERPETSIRGWERAADAQTRILNALRAVAEATPQGDIAVVAHGGVGALTRAHLLGQPIDLSHGQPGKQGGCVFEISLPGWRLSRDWMLIEDFEAKDGCV